MKSTPATKLADPAAKLADRLIAEAHVAAGGPVAWSRLGDEARLDVIRSRAWLLVQARVDDDRPNPHVADVVAAMAAVYRREVL